MKKIMIPAAAVIAAGVAEVTAKIVQQRRIKARRAYY